MGRLRLNVFSGAFDVRPKMDLDSIESLHIGPLTALLITVSKDKYFGRLLVFSYII